MKQFLGRVHGVEIREMLTEGFETFFFGAVIEELFVKGIKSVAEGLSVGELVVLLRDNCRDKRQVRLDYESFRYISSYLFDDSGCIIYDVDFIPVYHF